jgi:7-carboxy-7-deazaguanine synthase
MYGTNDVEPHLRGTDGLTLDIKEVFPTLQGEGPFAGVPATFVRLGGCHLRCWFCDTNFTDGRTVRKLADLVQEVDRSDNQLVVLTGGEPMRQNIVPLCIELSRLGMKVQIETAGSFWACNDVDGMRLAELCERGRVHIVVSPKTGYVNSRIAEYADSWKYIIDLSGPLGPDGLPANNPQNTASPHHWLARPPMTVTPENIYLQPCDVNDEKINAETVQRCVALCQQHGYRLSLQQHKLLGLP